MKIAINTSILDKYNISLEEYLLLFLYSRNINILELNKGLLLKGFAKENAYKKPELVLSEEQKELIQSIYIDSQDIVESKEDRFNNLALKLMQIYPEGKKPGTNYYWRDSKKIISDRLKKLVVKYKVEFTDEQAINATKKYVESFNGNYKYMHLLKYFICKNTNVGTEIEQNSQLLSYIENEGQSEYNNEYGELI